MQFPPRRGRPKETIKNPYIKIFDTLFNKIREVLKSDKEAR